MKINYIGETALSYLVNKCKTTFATLTHTHTYEDVGADASGSASAALAISEGYTDEKVGELSETVTGMQTELNGKIDAENITSIPSADIQSLFASSE